MRRSLSLMFSLSFLAGCSGSISGPAEDFVWIDQVFPNEVPTDEIGMIVAPRGDLRQTGHLRVVGYLSMRADEMVLVGAKDGACLDVGNPSILIAPKDSPDFVIEAENGLPQVLVEGFLLNELNPLDAVQKDSRLSIADNNELFFGPMMNTKITFLSGKPCKL